MGIVQQPAANQILQKRAGGQLPAQTLHVAGHLQGRNRVVGMQPGTDQAHEQIQAVRVLITADFTETEFELMQSRFNLILGKPLLRHCCQSLENQGLDLVPGIDRSPLQPDGEVGFAIFIGITAARRQVLAQPRIKQGLIEGCGRIAQQQFG